MTQDVRQWTMRTTCVGQHLKNYADQNIQPFNYVIDFQEIIRLIIVHRIITETITTTNSNKNAIVYLFSL